MPRRHARRLTFGCARQHAGGGLRALELKPRSELGTIPRLKRGTEHHAQRVEQPQPLGIRVMCAAGTALARLGKLQEPARLELAEHHRAGRQGDLAARPHPAEPMAGRRRYRRELRAVVELLLQPRNLARAERGLPEAEERGRVVHAAKVAWREGFVTWFLAPPSAKPLRAGAR